LHSRRSRPGAPRPIVRDRAKNVHGSICVGPARDQRAFALAYAFQKLNIQPADLLRLLLLKPVPGSVNEMSTAHLRAGSTLHPLECAGSLENAPVALSADEQ
jgi:hypothetical protein